MPERPKIELGAYKQPESTDDDLVELQAEDLEPLEEQKSKIIKKKIVDRRSSSKEAEDVLQRYHAWRNNPKIASESRSALSEDTEERTEAERLKSREGVGPQERFMLEEKKIDALIASGEDPDELREGFAMDLNEAEEGLAELLQEIEEKQAQDTGEQRIAYQDHRTGERQSWEALIALNRHRLEYLDKRDQKQNVA